MRSGLAEVQDRIMRLRQAGGSRNAALVLSNHPFGTRTRYRWRYDRNVQPGTTDLTTFQAHV
ncbi:MAG: hypothetical protein R2818_02445 [Flavobacteriales bacterium]